MANELLTAKEAAQRLRVTPRTIARWAESGRLPHAHKIAGTTGAYLFRPEDVDAAAAAVA